MMPAPKQSLSGSFGKVKIGGVSICVSNYTVTATANWEETPDTCNPGVKIRSLIDRDWSADITTRYDGSNPPSIKEGDVITDLQLGNKVGSTETIEFSAAYGVVGTRKRNNPVPGAVTYELGLMAQGDFQWGPLPTPPAVTP